MKLKITISVEQCTEVCKTKSNGSAPFMKTCHTEQIQQHYKKPRGCKQYNKYIFMLLQLQAEFFSAFFKKSFPRTFSVT